MSTGGGGGALVIGIGNPLRGDDGVGWHLVAGLGLQRHQLTPELAETVATAERLLVVDAWLAPPGAGPRLREVIPAQGWEGDSHRVDPARLLAMAALLFDRRVPGHELLVPGFDFSCGDRFSRRLQRQLPEARRLLRRWLEGPVPIASCMS
jgi:hydrogenase maturation protease